MSNCRNIFNNVLGKPNNDVEVNFLTSKRLIRRQNLLKVSLRNRNLGETSNSGLELQLTNVQIKEDEDVSKHFDSEKPSCSQLNVNALTTEELKYEIPKKLIGNMINCGENEEEYMECFKKFVFFEDHCKKGEIISEVELDNEFLSDNIQQINLKGQQNDRMSMRNEILSQYDPSNGRNEEYDCMVENLINLEEGFI